MSEETLSDSPKLHHHLSALPSGPLRCGGLTLLLGFNRFCMIACWLRVASERFAPGCVFCCAMLVPPIPSRMLVILRVSLQCCIVKVSAQAKD